ncbi:MAG: hypothetical protein IPI23_07730 [Bacteroidetes bacterium]|nr:hypothetical protein [Bacteroidota bacterium]
MYHRWNGAEMMFYAGKHLGVYANLRDNYMSKAITGPDFLTQHKPVVDLKIQLMASPTGMLLNILR